jgi:hypothetical protein
MALALRNSYLTKSLTPTQTGVSVVANDIIIVFIGGGSASNETTTCADNGSGGSNSYNKETAGIYSYLFPLSSMIVDVFTAKAKATNASLTITVTTTCTNIDDISVFVISGAASSSYVENIIYKDFSVAATSFDGASITTTNANDFLACFWDSDYNGVTWSENGGGFTIANQSITGAISYRIVSSTGTYADAVSTGADQQWPCCVLVAIKEASSTYNATLMLAMF